MSSCLLSVIDVATAVSPTFQAVHDKKTSEFMRVQKYNTFPCQNHAIFFDSMK